VFAALRESESHDHAHAAVPRALSVLFCAPWTACAAVQKDKVGQYEGEALRPANLSLFERVLYRGQALPHATALTSVNQDANQDAAYQRF
jgi:hypothetical protein